MKSADDFIHLRRNELEVVKGTGIVDDLAAEFGWKP
jgi:hypothetical protein